MQRFRADAKQDQHTERVLQKVVVERGTELANEKRKKAPFSQQSLEHRRNSVLGFDGAA
jgi:hypothetical protein